MLKIRITALFPAAACKVNPPICFIDKKDVADDPGALGDLVLEGTGFAVIKIEMAPAVTLGEPEDLRPVSEDPDIGPRAVHEVELNEGRALFLDEESRLSRTGIGRPEADGFIGAFFLDGINVPAVLAPPGLLHRDR